MTTTEEQITQVDPGRINEIESFYLMSKNRLHFLRLAGSLIGPHTKSDKRALWTAMSKIEMGDPCDTGSDWMIIPGESEYVHFRGSPKHVKHVLYMMAAGIELPLGTALIQYAGSPGSVNPLHVRPPGFGETIRSMTRAFNLENEIDTHIPKRAERESTQDMAFSALVEKARVKARMDRKDAARLLMIPYSRYSKLINLELQNWRLSEVVQAISVFPSITPNEALRKVNRTKEQFALGEGEGLVGGSPYTKTDYRDSDSWEPEHA